MGMFSRQGILLFPSKEYWNRGEKNCSLYYFISRLSEGKIRALYNLTIISRSQELKCHILNLLYSVSYFYFPISKFRKKKIFFFCLFVRFITCTQTHYLNFTGKLFYFDFKNSSLRIRHRLRL